MIAYGLACMWWDHISYARVDRTPTGDTFRCPKCGGKCELHTDRETFLKMARRFELIGFTGHYDMMVWSQGRCFTTRHDAWIAYRLYALQTPPRRQDALFTR